MRAIVDTHALIWAVDNPKRLSPQARAIIEDPANQRLFSSGSIWELAIKVGLGKLTLSSPFRRWMDQAVADMQLTVLPISIECAAIQASLHMHHRDPFDRLLVAHALIEAAPLISSDAVFDGYPITRIW